MRPARISRRGRGLTNRQEARHLPICLFFKIKQYSTPSPLNGHQPATNALWFEEKSEEKRMPMPRISFQTENDKFGRTPFSNFKIQTEGEATAYRRILETKPPIIFSDRPSARTQIQSTGQRTPPAPERRRWGPRGKPGWGGIWTEGGRRRALRDRRWRRPSGCSRASPSCL